MGESLFCLIRCRDQYHLKKGLLPPFLSDFCNTLYDDFPHPNDPTLAATHPHHKHVPPNIKKNRIPAPGFSFKSPNLPQILQELEAVMAQAKQQSGES